MSSETLKQAGGRRRRHHKGTHKKRKMSKGASEWTTKVVKLYREMKKTNSNVKFGDALRKASQLKKQGKL